MVKTSIQGATVYTVLRIDHTGSWVVENIFERYLDAVSYIERDLSENGIKDAIYRKTYEFEIWSTGIWKFYLCTRVII